MSSEIAKRITQKILLSTLYFEEVFRSQRGAEWIETFIHAELQSNAQVSNELDLLRLQKTELTRERDRLWGVCAGLEKRCETLKRLSKVLI